MFGLTEPLLAAYLLIVVRISVALVLMPMFGGQQVPPHTKIGLGLFLGLIVLPLQEAVTLPPGAGPLLLGILRETLVGATIGLAVLLVYQGMTMAADAIGVQMGLGLGQVFDPMTGAASTELRRFYNVLASLLFFLINAHHLVIAGLVATFTLVPLNTFDASTLSADGMIALSAAVFVVALQIAIPVVAALFIADLGMAVVARTMPQLNVLVVGMPVKVTLGMVMIMASLPLTTQIMQFTFGTFLADLSVFLTAPQG